MTIDRYDRTLSLDNYIEGYPDLVADDELVLVTPEDFARLAEYSATIPTGKSVGKVWKAGNRYGWYFCEYRDLEPPHPTDLLIIRRQLEVCS